MKENIVLKKSFQFAVRIVKMHVFLSKKLKQYELSGATVAQWDINRSKYRRGCWRRVQKGLREQTQYRIQGSA
jgi:hypothetical protein